MIDGIVTDYGDNSVMELVYVVMPFAFEFKAIAMI